MALRLSATQGCGPSTANFIIKHPALLDVTMGISLREGAPVVQMLEAPEDFVEGSAEPWIVNILCALLKASNQRQVLETGAFVGGTARWLAGTLGEMGGGELVACEIDPERASVAQRRLEAATFPPTVSWRVVQDDVLSWIQAQPDESLGFVWVDDDHTKAHVALEIETLLPKMVRGGLICGHDVWGSCDLQEVFARFGGYALDLPRLGPAGGLGLLQVR